jgi:hypothetical protein
MEAPLARDRCLEYQGGGCWCEQGAAAADVAQRWRAEEEKLESAKGEGVLTKHRTRKYPAWKLRCHYRGCGKAFTQERRWGAKSFFCCEEHRRAESNARRAERKAEEWPAPRLAAEYPRE